MKCRVALFEDNFSLRTSLVSLLQNDDAYTVVGSYNDVLGVGEVIKDIEPNLVILDIDMPGRDGIWAIPIIKEINPLIQIVMYTQFEENERIFESLCAGADGYILKKTSPFKLVEKLQEVLDGGAPMSPSIAKKVFASFRTSKSTAQLKYKLTNRETEVLKLLVKGYSIKAIANLLDIAYETCRSHLKNIYIKLHVNCGKEAIAKVLAEKITIL